MGSSGVKRFGPPSAERDLPTIIVDETFIRRAWSGLLNSLKRKVIQEVTCLSRSLLIPFLRLRLHSFL
jgi:hypothetical protein